MFRTSSIRSQLALELGSSGLAYWNTLSDFLNGRLAKAEFEELIQAYVSTPKLVQLHNALLLSLLESATLLTPPTPPPDLPKQTRKRKRLLPYQGPGVLEDEGSLRSKRLKRWVIGAGRVERDRLKTVDRGITKPEGMIKGRDEYIGERGVHLIWEGRDPPGTHLPLHLAQVSRAPTAQHISERIALISAQNGLSTPSKQVSSLMLLAFEAKIKHLVTHALTLTSSSRAITSINPSVSHGGMRALGLEAFRTMFLLAPHALPNGSAAGTRLAFGISDPDNVATANETTAERHHDDPRWQILSLLKERSGVREVLDS